MMIPWKSLIRHFGVRPGPVIHVGAHLAEESKTYTELRFGPCFWIEAQSHLIPKILEIVPPQDKVRQAVAWSSTGRKLQFNVANNSESSSVFLFGTHSEHHPQIIFQSSMSVETSRLDDIVPREFGATILVLDIQGAELEAILGMGDLMNSIKYIYSEVSREVVYSGGAVVEELDDYLKSLGFKRVATHWTKSGWGDAFYVRRGGMTLSGKLLLRVQMMSFHSASALTSSVAHLVSGFQGVGETWRAFMRKVRPRLGAIYYKIRSFWGPN